MSLIHVKPGDCSPLTISWLSIFKYLNDDFISLTNLAYFNSFVNISIVIHLLFT